MFPIKLPFSSYISKQMFCSHEYRGVSTKCNLVILQAQKSSQFYPEFMKLSVRRLHNLLFPSCLSGWKSVSLPVFGMKHLWDIHFLLLILVYLLGGVTSQVNPGVCKMR